MSFTCMIWQKHSGLSAFLAGQGQPEHRDTENQIRNRQLMVFSSFFEKPSEPTTIGRNV